jgi:hypothetical protein
MQISLRAVVPSTPLLVLALAFPLALTPQSRGSRVLVTQPVNENVLHRLSGNTRAQVTAQNDAGAVADSLAMEHMLLQLQRPPEQEQALRELIDSQHDAKASRQNNLTSFSCALAGGCSSIRRESVRA